MTNGTATGRHLRPGGRHRLIGRVRRHPIAGIAIYVLLLIASNIVQAVDLRAVSADSRVPRTTTVIPVQTAVRGADESDTRSLSAIRFTESGTRPPVILLHGSPGDATNFLELGPFLCGDDRPVYALDMPGFGLSDKWVPDYGAEAYARYMLAFMDARGIERAHVVGWSNGGAVALHACGLAPDRVASLTLLAAIACQETEGSGDYYFEHAKYAVGYAGLVALPELIPHFGLLGPRSFRHAFIRNFWDTDQRPIRAIMESLETPTLVLHGRHDPLVSDWAAERHHELIPTSRLVMTPHSHFLPFLQPEETADLVLELARRHDEPGSAALTDALVYEPRGGQPWFWNLLTAVRSIPWPVASLAIFVLAVIRRETATAFAGFLVGHGVLDFGVAFIGLFVGRLASRPPCAPRRGVVRRALTTLAWTAVSLLVAQIALSSRSGFENAGPFTLAYGIVVVSLLLNLLKTVATRTGRRSIANALRRARHHEWWPAPVLYLTILPSLLRLAIRHRSLTVWTCVNPGIRPGGGIAGENKSEILKGLDQGVVLEQRALNGAPDAALAEARALIEEDPAFALPVAVKPEAGERGAAVTIVRTPDALGPAIAAASAHGATPVLQRYHPGPVEIGVFWIRDPETVGDERTDAVQGRILAVTRKVLPEVVGDGEHTIDALIDAHPRYRLQAAVLREHFAGHLEDIPVAGDAVRLSGIGNHARGCRFEDGADLVTPALEDTIDHLARTWRGPDGEPFDYGRFDLRAASDDDVREGRGLAVIELNGVTSEATGLYDPSWTLARARRLLAQQWSAAFELGAARRAKGQRPLGVLRVLKAARGPRRPPRVSGAISPRSR